MGIWQGQVGQLSDFVLNEVANLRVWSSIITLGLPVIDTCKMEDVRRARRMFLLASMRNKAGYTAFQSRTVGQEQ